MDTLLTVALLGLSFEGLVICPFFVFGLSLADKLAGLRFLLGRLIGLVCFGVLVSLLGRAAHIDERIVNGIFGVSLVALGLYRYLDSENSGLIWKLRVIKSRLGLKSGCGGKGPGSRAGFGLGLFRGLCNPGRKYLYLAPFLLDLGVFKGLALSFTYGVSSSIYLFLGFASAGFMNRLVSRRRLLERVGATLLVLVGGYYIWKSRILTA